MKDKFPAVDCPYCTYRFDVPDATFRLYEHFLCPQCDRDFMVTSIAPVEFGEWQNFETMCSIRPFWLAQEDLIHAGMKVHLPDRGLIHVLTDKAAKQGNQEVTLRITFPEWPSKEAVVEFLAVG